MKKRLLALSLTTSLLVAMLAGCGEAANTDTSGTPSDTDASTSDTANTEPREVSITVTQSQNVEGLPLMLEKMKNEKNIVADFQVIPDDQFLSMTTMKFNSGEAPDISGYNIPNFYYQLDPTEHFIDLTDEEWTSRLINPDVSTYSDGHIYGYSFYSTNGYQGAVYNKQVFEDNGVEIPTTPEEWYAVCDTLKAAGITPILIPGGDYWMPQIWTTSGYARALGTKEAALDMTAAVVAGDKTFNDYPEMGQAFDELLALKDKGYLNSDLSTLTTENARTMVAEGDAAMMICAAKIIDLERAVHPDVDLGIFNPPLAVDPEDTLSATLYSYGMVGNKASEDPELVKEVFRTFADPAYGDLYFTNAPCFPALEGINGGDQDEDILSLYNKHQEAGTIVPEMNLAWGIFDPLLGEYLWGYYDEALAKGDMTGADVLDKFQSDADKYLESIGARD